MLFLIRGNVKMLQQPSRSFRPTLGDSPGATNSGYVIGVDLGGTNLRLALANMGGTILARCSMATAGIQDPAEIIAAILDGVEQLLRENSLSQDLVRAIGVGAPGVTDVDAGVVIATSYLMGWRDVPLRALLESAFGVPAAIENDVNAAAMGERWAGAAKTDRDFVFLAIGSGVGAGIVLHDRIFHGMAWRAGEIGYMLVPGTSEIPASAGEPGALEHLVGGQGIKAQWQAVWSEESTPLPKNLNATQIFDHALGGDLLARKILERAARTIAYAIYDISLILNCPLFVLGGGVGTHPVLCESVRKILAERDGRVQPRIAVSTLGADAQLMGAVRLALDTATRQFVHRDL
jgi:glucokinase